MRRCREPVAGDGGRAGVGHEQRGEDRQERRLAGAVRPEKADDLARVDVERYAGQRDPRSVALGDALDRDLSLHDGQY